MGSLLHYFVDVLIENMKFVDLGNEERIKNETGINILRNKEIGLWEQRKAIQTK